MNEFITMGEPLVVFCSTQLNVSVTNATNFSKVIGGAELNVAIGVNRLGHSAEYISQVGEDPQGKFIQEQIKDRHINTKYLKETDKYLTGYQMKQLVSQGDPNVYNFRKDSAASHISSRIIEKINLNHVKYAHLTGIMPGISEEARKSCFEFAKKCNKNKVLLTFDPNLRPHLWTDLNEMKNVINNLAKYADIILPGQKEGEFLTGTSDPEKIADFYLKSSQTKAVFVKVGSKGSYVKTKLDEHGKFIPGFKVKKVVDTVGAGDGFAVGVITALMENKGYLEAARRGNAIGAMQVQTHGDNDGYPTRNQLKKFYESERIKKMNLPKFTSLEKVHDAGIVGVIRGNSEENAYKTAQACIKGGITAIELAFTSPSANITIKKLSDEYSNNPNIVIGAGTVLEAETARLAIIAGAKFIVSPSFNEETAKECNLYGVPYIPGCFSPTEIQKALSYGSDIVKIFPGSIAGKEMIKEIHGPFPYVNVMPSGGVSIDNMNEWFNAGAYVVGIGGSLVEPAKSDDFEGVTANARAFKDELNNVKQKNQALPISI